MFLKIADTSHVATAHPYEENFVYVSDLIKFGNAQAYLLQFSSKTEMGNHDSIAVYEGNYDGGLELFLGDNTILAAENVTANVVASSHGITIVFYTGKNFLTDDYYYDDSSTSQSSFWGFEIVITEAIPQKMTTVKNSKMCHS